MQGFALIFIILASIAVLKVSRENAPLPLLIGTCYLTLGQTIELGPITLSGVRILIAIGYLRVFLRKERLANGMNSLDWLMVSWAVWALFCSQFHQDPFAFMINTLGMVFNTCGIYFLLRIFCQSYDDVMRICRALAIVLIPVAIEMVLEKAGSHNHFSFLGGVPEMPGIREGKVRAQGPFAHAILAGTVGAVNLPIMFGIWSRYRKVAIFGIAACAAMVFASSSSGPIMSALVSICTLCLWRYRRILSFGKCLGFVAIGYIGLNIFMSAPAYFILARIDITGGSTGWYRARLIQVAFERIGEWWLWGTDYTRHWMPTGVPYSPNHADIVNHYLVQGVRGGLPLMLLFIAIIVKGFFILDRGLKQKEVLGKEYRFMLWAIGAVMASHATTFVSVTYFDQSFFFLYLILAVIGSSQAVVKSLIQNNSSAIA